MTSDFPTRNAAGEAVITGPLYHYTSVEALKGIVEDRIFQATHAFYLSDATEIRYGIERIRRECSASMSTGVVPGEVSSQLRDWLKDLIFTPVQVFVVCFSQKDDDLNQWRSGLRLQTW